MMQRRRRRSGDETGAALRLMRRDARAKRGASAGFDVANLDQPVTDSRADSASLSKVQTNPVSSLGSPQSRRLHTVLAQLEFDWRQCVHIESRTPRARTDPPPIAHCRLHLRCNDCSHNLLCELHLLSCVAGGHDAAEEGWEEGQERQEGCRLARVSSSAE